MRGSNSHPSTSRRVADLRARTRQVLVGCGLGLLALVGSACSHSEATRADLDADLTPRDTVAVEATERLPEPAATPAPTTTAVARLIEDALRADGNITKAALMRRLGPPDRVTTEPVRNAYALNRTDTVRTLIYRGVEAMLYEATQSGQTFLIRLVLTSRRYRSPEGLRVGMRQVQVINRIGPPSERDAATGELIYAERASMPTALILTVRRGRVTQIAWEFYFS